MKINLPKTLFEHIEINKENFITKVEVKDVLDSQGVGTWFNNDQIGNTLELVVIKAKTADVREFLSSKGVEYGIIASDPDLPSEKAKEIIRTFLTFRDGTTTDDKVSLMYDRVRDNTHVRKRGLNHDYLGSKDEIIESEKSAENETHVYYDFEFPFSRLDNDILSGQSEGDLDISVFAFVKTNNNEVQEKFDFAFREGEYYHGDVSSEKIVSNNNFHNTSWIYRTATNNIFKGVVEDNGNGQVEGVRSNGSRITLTREQIKNFKIVNNRDKVSLKSFVISFNNSPYKVIKGSNVTRDNMFDKQKPSYFSELSHTKNKLDNVVATFSVNKEELLTRNTLFGPLLSSMTNIKKQEIVDKCRFKSVVIRRIRIADMSERVTGINTTKNEYAKLDENEPDTIILSSGESTEGNFVEVNNSRAYFKEENVHTSSPQSSIKSFSFEDRTFRDITDGIYQYEVEIEMTDPVIDYMTERMESLNNEISRVSEYYHFSNSKKMFYRDSKKRFSNKFGQIVRAKYENSPASYPWVTSPAKYIDILTEFAPSIGTGSKNKFLLNVFSSISPDTGNPEEINTFLNLMQTLSKKLEELSGLSSKPSISSGLSTQSVTSNQSSKNKGIKTHKQVHKFPLVVGSENRKNFGYEYLDLGNGSGLKRINEVAYGERATEETEKFFASAEEVLSIEGSAFPLSYKELSFLTPRKFINGNQSMSLPLSDTSKYRDLQSLITTNGQVETDSSRTEFSSTLFSVTVEPQVDDEESVSNSQDRVEVNHTQTQVTATEKKVNNFYEILEKTLNGTENPFTETLSMDEIHSSADRIWQLPNQIKAIVLNNGSLGQQFYSSAMADMISNYTSYGSVLFQMLYGQMVRVEYLSGYTTNTEGKLMINSPTWRLLDSTTISSVAGQSILCRLSYYIGDDELFPIEKNELFDINVYDSIFLLKVSPNAGDGSGTGDGGSGDGGSGDGDGGDGSDDDGPLGICVLPDGTQEEMTQTECLAAGGSWTSGTSDSGADGTGGQSGSSESENRCILLDSETADLNLTNGSAQSNVIVNFDPDEVGSN